MMDYASLETLGAFVAGYGFIELIKLLMRRFVNKVESGITQKEFETYKADTSLRIAEVKVEAIALVKEVKDSCATMISEMKSACYTKQAACAECIKDIQAKQLDIRQRWPNLYLDKEGFREWKESWEKWLKSIDEKVDKILEREIQGESK